MYSQYYKLKHDDRDRPFKFRRPHWDSNLWFIWSSQHQQYKYLREDGSESGSTPGDQVLEAANIMIKKENEMSKNVNYIGTDYEVVAVSYELNTIEEPLINTYYFKTDRKLVKGDTIVVESVNGLGLCIVLEDSIPRSLDTVVIKMFNKAEAWVVDIVDTRNQDKRREATERKKFIVEQLSERREAMEEVAIYKLLAESDPDAAKLLQELESLK